MPENFEFLHDFSDAEVNDLNSLINNLKHTFKELFAKMNGEYSKIKSEADSIRRKIRAAEKDAEDEYIAKLRSDKETFDKRVFSIDKDINDYGEKIGGIKNEISRNKLLNGCIRIDTTFSSN